MGKKGTRQRELDLCLVFMENECRCILFGSMNRDDEKTIL